jgi:hypothetical protein
MTMTIAPTHAVQLWPMRSSSDARRRPGLAGFGGGGGAGGAT